MKSKIVCSLTAALMAIGPLSSALPALAAPNPRAPTRSRSASPSESWGATADHLDLLG